MTVAAADLRPVAFAALAGWQEDDPRPLFATLSACCAHIRAVKPYRSGALGLDCTDLAPLMEDHPGPLADAAAARAFFETRCTPFLIEPRSGGQGFVTAFYEPEIAVRERPDAVFRFPFHRRPGDLVDLDDHNRPAGLDPTAAFGRDSGNGIVAYADRGEIDRGFLDGRGLEIAWAASKADVFFAHVQGAARLVYPGGSVRRITYAAKSGHPFSAIGAELVRRGEIAREDISMQSIRAWLAARPDEMDELLWHNRSYIFFREADVSDPALGPVAAAKVPLPPGRALAVDRLIHTFGFPFFIRAPELTHLDAGRPFARLMLALDTGSAITGPARGDIFTGSGAEAGELAGTVRHHADFYILIPNAAARRYAAACVVP